MYEAPALFISPAEVVNGVQFADAGEAAMIPADEAEAAAGNHDAAHEGQGTSQTGAHTAAIRKGPQSTTQCASDCEPEPRLRAQEPISVRPS
jgi:hypothetical protein